MNAGAVLHFLFHSHILSLSLSLYLEIKREWIGKKIKQDWQGLNWNKDGEFLMVYDAVLFFFNKLPIIKNFNFTFSISFSEIKWG